MFTVESPLGEIYDAPEFREFSKYMIPDMGILNGVLKKRQIGKLMKAWPAESIADGLNYMRDKVREGHRFFYRLYGETECRMDCTLKDVIMFHFPAPQDVKHAKAVIVCAGGGYQNVCSFVEAFPIAKRINELGYHAFVLNYRTGKAAGYPNPMNDLAKCIKELLDHSEEFECDMEGYAICGFSAGGHLVASFGTEKLGWKHYRLPAPGCVILGYPVITMGKYTHKGSKNNLLGKGNRKNSALIEMLSVENQITETYPPTWLWQCAKDNTVPIENSRMLAEELKNHSVNYRYKTYDSTDHGWGIAANREAEGWLDEAIAFWENV